MRHVPTHPPTQCYPIGYRSLMILAGCLSSLLLAVPAEAQRGKSSDLRKSTVTRSQARGSTSGGSKFIVNTKARIQGPSVSTRARTPVQGPRIPTRASSSSSARPQSSRTVLQPKTSARIAPPARTTHSSSTRHGVTPTPRTTRSTTLIPKTSARLSAPTVTRSTTTVTRGSTAHRPTSVTRSRSGHGSHNTSRGHGSHAHGSHSSHSSHAGHGHSSHGKHSSHKTKSRSGFSIVIGSGIPHRPHVTHGSHVHKSCVIYTRSGSRYCRVHGHGHHGCSLYRTHVQRTHVYRPHIVHTPVRTACVVVHYPGTTIKYCKSHHFGGHHTYCPVPHANGWDELSHGHFAVAESVFKHQLIHDPYNARLRVGYSLAVAMNGDHPRAVSEMRKAVASHSGVLRTIHLSPTTMNYVTKEISHYKSALSHTKFKADVSFMVAALEVLHGHYSEAKRYLDYARHYGDHSTSRYRLESDVNRELHHGSAGAVRRPGYLGDY